MAFPNKEIMYAVRAQLAIDLNCSADDFDREGYVFCEARENPGRRPFPRGKRHFEMLTMGGAVIVSATSDILPYLREQLQGKSYWEAFDMPFVYGTGHYFMPDYPNPLSVPDGVEITVADKSNITALYRYEGFTNALQYDANHSRPDALAVVARINGDIAGIAGASADCDMLWQIGIDVLPEHRNHGIAAVLTNRLAIEILTRGKVPYYGTASSNLASQSVAHRAGFKPAWVCAYRGLFDGVLTEASG